MPEINKADNATVYMSDNFRNDCENNKINLATSIPGYPQSNGMAEVFIKIVRALVIRCEGYMIKINAGLRQYCNTPINDKLPSPATLIQGRIIQDRLPRQCKTFIPKSYDYSKIQKRRAIVQSNQKHYYDRKARKELEVLREGEHVRVLRGDRWESGLIKNKCEEPRSYMVATGKETIGEPAITSRKQMNKLVWVFHHQSSLQTKQ